jgi:hypothetical protein
MSRHSISKKRYLDVGQVFHWATREHYQLLLTGRSSRHSRTEKVLPRLVKDGKLIARILERRLVYAAPRKARSTTSKTLQSIEHGLGCSECLVRIWLSRNDGEIIAEKYFRKFRIVPEWGIRYPHHVLLLLEFSTEDNFNRSGLITGKLIRYLQSLEIISKAFNCHSAMVLFVMDVQRERVERFVRTHHPIGSPFFFTDYETFQKVPIGNQLASSIYIWEDGNTYPLAKNN